MAEKPYYLLNTFAERQKAREKATKSEDADTKAVETDEVEDKAVGSSETKKRATARKK